MKSKKRDILEEQKIADIVCKHALIIQRTWFKASGLWPKVKIIDGKTNTVIT